MKKVREGRGEGEDGRLDDFLLPRRLEMWM
jgi:hypothetical protein